MAIQQVRAVLIAAPSVTALVPATRIEPLRRTQGLGLPAITLQRVTDTPTNYLLGDALLDANLVQLDVFDDDYTNARLIADTCRTALYAGGIQMQSEIELYEPETDPELYRITQTWSVYT